MTSAILRSFLLLPTILLMMLAPSLGACGPGTSALPAANTYFVATGGDDANPGTESAPWATIQHAADSVGPGDTVFVRGGVYDETVEISVSGSETEGYITFQSYPDETAILDGSGLLIPAWDAAMLRIDSQSYITIAGFELRNYATSTAAKVPMGVYVAGDAHHIRLLNNHIHHIENNGGADGNAHGIAIYGTEAPAAIHDILIQGNELHGLKLGNSEAVVLNGNVTDFAIIDNIVYDNDNIGIDLIGFEGTAPDPAYDQARDGVVKGNVVYNIDTITNPAYGGERAAGGIYVDGGTRITIERNVVHDSNIGIEIASEHAGRATSQVRVQNNLIYDNHIAGLAMGGYDTNRGSTEDCTIVNNTFLHNDSEQDGNGELYIQYDTRNNIIANNIFYANAQSLLISNAYTQNSGNVVDYNLYFAPAGEHNSEWQWQDVGYQGFDAYRVGSGNDAHSLFADPLFVDEIAPDLNLLAGSPAIGVADPSLAPGEDFSGHYRPIGAGPDIGAYEAGLPHPTYLPHITISVFDANDLRLTWANDTVFESYRVWRSSVPYFTPAGTPHGVVVHGPWRFDDAGALGEANSNYFYLIEGVQYDGGSTISGRVGEFDFEIR